MSTQGEDVIRRACSDPDFITMIYILIKRAASQSNLPSHKITVIGGAAFILHAYMSNGRDLGRMQEAIQAVPPTSDIDLALWYDAVVDKATFIRENDKMVNKIRENFVDERFVSPLQRILKLLLPDPSVIQTFEIEVPVPIHYKDMTTTVHVDFIVNEQRFTVVDIAMKNAIYSQPTVDVVMGNTMIGKRRIRSNEMRKSIPIDTNISYTNINNTVLLQIKNKKKNDPDSYDEYVRVPTVERLLEQQQYALRQQPDKSYKYQPRIDYLTSLLQSSKGGKRRTHRKNKNKRRHTKRRY